MVRRITNPEFLGLVAVGVHEVLVGVTEQVVHSFRGGAEMRSGPSIWLAATGYWARIAAGPQGTAPDFLDRRRRWPPNPPGLDIH
jgi:hypothetical protein